MYGIELNKGVSVVSVFENAGKKKVKYIRGSDIGEATVRTVNINEKPVEYFLCHGLRIFLDDLYVSNAHNVPCAGKKGGRIAHARKSCLRMFVYLHIRVDHVSWNAHWLDNL